MTVLSAEPHDDPIEQLRQDVRRSRAFLDRLLAELRLRGLLAP